MSDDTPDGYTVADLTNFTKECVDCGRTIRVVDGRKRRHWCRCPRRLRGRAGDAWAEGYEWGKRDAERIRA